MHLLAIIAAGYALGAVITYGVLIDRPQSFDLEEMTDDLRASRPDVSERQIQNAKRVMHKVMSTMMAALWPLTLGAALLDLSVAIHRRLTTRK